MRTAGPAERLCVAQDACRAEELRAAAGDRIETGDDLDVVVEDVRSGGDHPSERHLLTLEVGRQDLDLAVGRLAADLGDHADEGAGAEVGEVVAVDRGDHRVAEPHPGDRPGDAGRLERIVPRRLPGLHVAEAAAAGARVAEDHEGRGPTLPAFADVRAGGLLADGVEVGASDQLVSARWRGPPGAGTLNHGGLRARMSTVFGPSRSRTFIPPGLARERVTCAGSFIEPKMV